MSRDNPDMAFSDTYVHDYQTPALFALPDRQI